MSNILVLTDRIPPEHSATGRITYHIADELGKTNDVYLVCLSDDLENNDGYARIIKVLSRLGKYKALQKKAESKRGLLKVYYKIIYHLYYKYAEKKGLGEIRDHIGKIKKVCQKIIKLYNIDTIISSSNPFDNQFIAYDLIKEHPEIKWYPYLMDSARNNAVRPIDRETELKVFEKANNLLIVPAITFDTEFIKDFSDKTRLVYLPIIPAKQHFVQRDDGKIIFIYAGMFYKDIRNPVKLLEIFLHLPENYELHLYCGGCSKEIEAYKEKLGDRLNVSGFVSPDELTDKINNCDILLNVCNSVINQIASKIYDMIAYGKPLLNFYQDSSDLTIEHVANYEMSLSTEYLCNDDNIRKIIDWSENMKGKRVSYLEATKNIPEKRLSSIVEEINGIIS